MDDHFSLSLFAAEMRFHEIDFGFHGSKVFLCAALEDETFAQLCQIGNAGDIEEDVLRQHSREAGKDFSCGPALPLEVDDVRLHEHRATITEDRHLIR